MDPEKNSDFNYDEERVDTGEASPEEPVAGVPQGGNLPEPPTRWRADQQMRLDRSPEAASNDDALFEGEMRGPDGVVLKGSDAAEFVKARRYMTISQIGAITSLIFGGVFLGSVAVGFAIVAFIKLNRIANAQDNLGFQWALKRAGIMALGMSIAALIVNVIALVMLYPTFMDAIQSGGFGSFGASSPSVGTGAGSSTWG